MIPCTELRIGNYVLIDGRLQKVSSLRREQDETASIDFVNAADNRAESCDAAKAQPATLTDEILQQCGFVLHNYFKFWQLITVSPDKRFEMDIDTDYNLIDFMRRPIVKRMTSLHQLQNIYFALKGEELAFQPKARATTPLHIVAD